MKQKTRNIYKIVYYFLPFLLFFATQKLALYLDGREGANGWLFSAVFMVFLWPLLTAIVAIFSPAKEKFDYTLMWVTPLSVFFLFSLPYLQEDTAFSEKMQAFAADTFNGYILSLVLVLVLVSWLCSYKKLRVLKKYRKAKTGASQ